MKKKLISLILITFLATGCFKKGSDDIIDDLAKKVNN